jgi:hypothetical protein
MSIGFAQIRDVINVRKLFLCLFAIVIASLALFLYKANDEVYDYKKDAEEATALMLSVFLEDGMSGLIALSKECYEHEKTTPQMCFVNDIASKIWDRGVTEAMKLPIEEYFNDERIVERLLIKDKEHSFTKAIAFAEIPKIEEFVKQRLVIEWGLQKHKLDSD